MSELPCSKVADKEIHKPHIYFYGGHDVRCLGYSPMREALSDEAETPEEFFGLAETRKTPVYPEDTQLVKNSLLSQDEIRDFLGIPPGGRTRKQNCYKVYDGEPHEAHNWRYSVDLVRCSGLYPIDPEIEKLLHEEEVVEARVKLGDDILREYMKGQSVTEVAEKFNLPIRVVVDVLGEDVMHNFPPHVKYNIDYPEPEDYTIFDRFVDWWERRSTSMQDFILLMLVVASVTLVALILGAIL